MKTQCQHPKKQVKSIAQMIT